MRYRWGSGVRIDHRETTSKNGSDVTSCRPVLTTTTAAPWSTFAAYTSAGEVFSLNWLLVI